MLGERVVMRKVTKGVIGLVNYSFGADLDLSYAFEWVKKYYDEKLNQIKTFICN